MQIFENLAKICRGLEGPVTLPKNRNDYDSYTRRSRTPLLAKGS